eukprot:COSAG05_NODE_19363_length_294_cov_0.271795_1_plen_42_part_10
MCPIQAKPKTHTNTYQQTPFFKQKTAYEMESRDLEFRRVLFR